jgi:hypothetical protein
MNKTVKNYQKSQGLDDSQCSKEGGNIPEEVATQHL